MVSGGQPGLPPCLHGKGCSMATEVTTDGPEPVPPSHCSLATPGAPLFAHGREHLANIGSQEVIHLVAQ